MRLLPLSENRHLLSCTATCDARASLPDGLLLFLRPPPLSSAYPYPFSTSSPSPDPVPAELADESAPFFRNLREYCLNRLKRHLASADVYVEVAVSDSKDGLKGEGEVLGYAVWERAWGERGAKQGGNRPWMEDSWGNSFERLALSVQDRYAALVRRDPFLSAPNTAVFQAAWAGFDDVVDRFLTLNPVAVESARKETAATAPEASQRSATPTKVQADQPSAIDSTPPRSTTPHPGPEGYIWLTFLAVDPAVQRRGVGGKLMDWGCRSADEERVPVGLTASVQGLGLYRKCGFVDVGERVRYAAEEDVFMVRWVEDPA